MIKKLTYQQTFLLNFAISKYQPIKSHPISLISTFHACLLPFGYKFLNTVGYNFATFEKKPSRPQQKSNVNKTDQKFKTKVEAKPLKMRPSKKEQKRLQHERQKSFALSVTDPQLFIEHINNKNNVQDAVKLMNRILNNKSLSKEQFEQKVWKKYSYYVHLIGENQVTQWYSKTNPSSTEPIPKNNTQENDSQNSLKQQKFIFNEDLEDKDQKSSEQFTSPTFHNDRIDNHELSRQLKRKRLCIQFLSQITQIHTRFKGQLISQNITKTFNKFVDHFFQHHQWSSLGFSERISLLQSVSRYNLKKAKTLFLKKREHLFDKPKVLQSPKLSSDQKQIYQSEDVVKVVSLIVKLQINDTAFFQKCIDLIYDHVHLMKLDKLENLTYLLGKTHKFVNKDLVIKIKQRFNQLINQFSDTEIVQSLHIISALSLIEKNMQLKSIYFQPLDVVYERIFPIFNSAVLGRLKSKFISSLASALRRSQYFDEAVINSLIGQSIKRDVLQFSQSDKDSFRNSFSGSKINNHFERSDKFSFETITIPHLTQIFFSLATFNYREPHFISYFVNLLAVVQESKDPEKYISYPMFSRLLWSICVLCNDQEIEKLLPLMEHFYKKSKSIQPHEATNFYYCYLLLKRKYLLGDIRFQNDKIQQYILGPKHQIQISQTQREIHKGLLQLGIPSLMEYNLNNLICDIYIPKFQDIQHLIIQVHGFHHFCRNVKKINGSTILKQKIIQNQGYECFYITLDEWLIAEDKTQFLKDFFQTIVAKKHAEKRKKRVLEESVKTIEKVEKRGRRVLQFRKSKRENSKQIEYSKNEQGLLQNNERSTNSKTQ